MSDDLPKANWPLWRWVDHYREQGAYEIQFSPDGKAITGLTFAPLPPVYAPPQRPRGGLPDPDDDPAEGPQTPQQARRERLAAKHSGLRSKDLRQAWREKVGRDGPRKVKAGT